MTKKIITALLTIVGLTFAIVETGCGSQRENTVKTPCASGTARPISVERARTILSKYGYDVTLRPDRCDVKDVAMELNAIPRTDKKALVICDVRLRPIYGKGFHRIGRIGLVQDNVMCGVYPGSKERAAAERKTLLATVRKMAMR